MTVIAATTVAAALSFWAGSEFRQAQIDDRCLDLRYALFIEDRAHRAGRQHFDVLKQDLIDGDDLCSELRLHPRQVGFVHIADDQLCPRCM